MLDLAIVLVLVVLNALAHSTYIRWRKGAPRSRPARRPVQPGVTYPTHPSPSAAAPEHAAIRPVGIDW